MTLPSPAVLIGNPKFKTWLGDQERIFTDLMSWYHGSSRFMGLACPTGSGKSLDALLVSKMSGARTVIVTASKGLQQQYSQDTESIGGVNLVGQNNFSCILVQNLRADEGPCHDGIPCPVKESCPYRVQLNKALNSQLVVTNYAYWLAQTNFSSGIGDVGLIVFDEAHQAFSALENYLTVFLSRLDVEPMGIHFPQLPATTIVQQRRKGKDTPATPNPTNDTPDDSNAPKNESNTPKNEDNALWSAWQSWADGSTPTAQERVAQIESDIKSYRNRNQIVPGSMSRAFRTAKSVLARLERLAGVNENWIIQQTFHGYRFVPKWVANYGDHLFHAVPKVMLMSAILSQKTCDYLGVPFGDQRSWLEAPSYFPPENTPIWHIPTARINFRTDDFGSTVWVSRIDQIIQRRQDRKGIVFTVSYERARMLLSRSRFKNIMLAHSTADVVQVVEQFKRMPAPAVLVSPSVTTGWDFPGNGQPQYIILGKIPYPDTRDEVTEARHEEDKDWSSYLAMDTLIQSAGRCTRSSEDQTEVFCVDNSIVWFMKLYAKFAPLWFQQRYRGIMNVVPDALF